MKIYLSFILLLIFYLKTYAQDNQNIENGLLLGLNYGNASRNTFIYRSPDYSYRNEFFKIQINYLLANKNSLSYELHIEPSLYFSEHQLLNKWFIQQKSGSDYLKQREYFVKKRNFMEYAINVGFIFRYTIINGFSTYVLGSIGPMISREGTERLTKGFAFSDILGLGFSLTHKKSDLTCE